MKTPAPPVDHFGVESRARSSRVRSLGSAFAAILAFAISVCVAPSAQMGSRTAGGFDPPDPGAKIEATGAEAAPGFAAGVQSSSTTYYLHGTGPADNPPTLLLDTTAPTATTANAKFKDSASINRNNGNPWVEVGRWPAASSLTSGTLTSLSDLHIWLGLKNSDDQGTNFDLRVEAYKNSTLITSGETLCVTGITRNATSAKEVVFSPASFAPVTFNGTSDVLSVKVLTRVGSTSAGASCGGHNNAVGLRLYFDAVSRASKLSANLGAADTTAPVLAVTQPADGSVTNQNSVNVTGTVSDSSPVTVTVNGTSVTVSNGSFSRQVNLNEGANQIHVAATDSSGNQSEVVRNVTRDTSPPTLMLIQPTDGQYARTAIVEGTVTDATGVTVTINGTSSTIDVDGVFSSEIEMPEGIQHIQVIATDAAGNQSVITRNVNIDKTPPVLSQIIPAGGALVDSPATVQGRAADTNAISVTVNDVAASVGAGGLFTAVNVPIAEGDNEIVIIADDAAGNSSIATVILIGRDRTPPPPPVLFPVVTPTRLAFQSIEGRTEPGATITITGGTEAVTFKAAFGTGLFISNVDLAPGTNALSVAATDAAGNTSPSVQVAITSNPNLPYPSVGQPAQINISTGNAQRGLVATEFPRPLIAIVTDTAGNPVPGVMVRFTALHGDGQFIGADNAIDAITDLQGRASVRYKAGNAPGIQIIRSDFAGNTITPTIFTAEALQGSSNAVTTVSGVVLDQNLRALRNVLVRLGGQQVRTGGDGRFLIANAITGPHQLLELIGRDQVTLPGRWPNLTYDVDVLPGVDNNVGRPLFLPRVNDGIALPLDSNNVVTQDTVYELPVVGGEQPITVTARAGTRVTFPPDATDKRLSVTRIANSRVPMSLEDGRATNLYISVQPAGAIFDPPLAVSFPNLDRLPASSQVLLMSFDHDAGRYVRVGTGRINADGRTVDSEPGGGIRIGAWHGFPANPPCPEASILGHIQIAGNPILESQRIIGVEAWVQGTRAVLIDGGNAIAEADTLNYRATLSLVCNTSAALVAVESTIQGDANLKVEFQTDDAKGLPSPLRLGITANRHNRTKKLKAVVTPRAEASKIVLSVDPTLQISNVSRKDSVIKFSVVGLMASKARGDAKITATHTSGQKFDHPVSVVVPDQIGTPHDTNGRRGLEISNVALNRTTSPAMRQVQQGNFILGTLYARWLNIVVWDQFKDLIGKDPVLGDLYTGADITETFPGQASISINQKLNDNSVYVDPVAIFTVHTPPRVVVDNDPAVQAWLASPNRIPITLAPGNYPASVGVEVDGFVLHPAPAIVNRTKVVAGANNFTIVWP